jgi:hypothetical protein
MQRRVRRREPSQAIKGVYPCCCTELVERDIADSLPTARDGTSRVRVSRVCVLAARKQEEIREDLMAFRQTWITAAIVIGDSAEEICPWSKRHKIKIGQTNPYSGPASSFGTIAAYYHLVNDLATFPWHLGVSSVAPKHITIGRLTPAPAAALATGWPTSYQPVWDHPGDRGSS